MARFARTHLLTIQKTGSYYLVHITVAACVAYAVTGDVLASLTLSLLEPTVQAFAFFAHEKAWERVLRRRARRPVECRWCRAPLRDRLRWPERARAGRGLHSFSFQRCHRADSRRSPDCP